MARICDMCGKVPKKAANRSHSNVKTLRVQKPNLQKIGGLNMCTRCLRTMNKMAAAM